MASIPMPEDGARAPGRAWPTHALRALSRYALLPLLALALLALYIAIPSTITSGCAPTLAAVHEAARQLRFAEPTAPAQPSSLYVHISREVAPFAAAGGTAGVVEALATLQALAGGEADASLVILPAYALFGDLATLTSLSPLECLPTGAPGLCIPLIHLNAVCARAPHLTVATAQACESIMPAKGEGMGSYHVLLLGDASRNGSAATAIFTATSGRDVYGMPPSVNPDTTKGDSWFQWRDAYFSFAAAAALRVLSHSHCTLLQRRCDFLNVDVHGHHNALVPLFYRLDELRSVDASDKRAPARFLYTFHDYHGEPHRFYAASTLDASTIFSQPQGYDLHAFTAFLRQSEDALPSQLCALWCPSVDFNVASRRAASASISRLCACAGVQVGSRSPPWNVVNFGISAFAVATSVADAVVAISHGVVPSLLQEHSAPASLGMGPPPLAVKRAVVALEHSNRIHVIPNAVPLSRDHFLYDSMLESAARSNASVREAYPDWVVPALAAAHDGLLPPSSVALSGGPRQYQAEMLQKKWHAKRQWCDTTATEDMKLWCSTLVSGQYVRSVMALFVGRAEQLKGVLMLPRALSSMCERLQQEHNKQSGGLLPIIHTVIMSYGEGIESVVTELKQLPLMADCTWQVVTSEAEQARLGQTGRVAADIMLIPSEVEAYGLVAAEALAHGAMPVVSNVGGLPDIVCQHAASTQVLRNMVMYHQAPQSCMKEADDQLHTLRPCLPCTAAASDAYACSVTNTGIIMPYVSHVPGCKDLAVAMLGEATLQLAVELATVTGDRRAEIIANLVHAAPRWWHSDGSIHALQLLFSSLHGVSGHPVAGASRQPRQYAPRRRMQGGTNAPSVSATALASAAKGSVSGTPASSSVLATASAASTVTVSVTRASFSAVSTATATLLRTASLTTVPSTSAFPVLPSRSASLTVGASPSPSSSPMLPKFSAAPSIDPAAAASYQIVTFKYTVAGARASELLSPAVLTPLISSFAAALNVPAANVVVASYEDKSSMAPALLRLLQAAGSASMLTELEFAVRTTPQTISAAEVAATVQMLPVDVLANITSVATAALAASTGRPATSFAALLDRSSVTVTAAVRPTATPASSSQAATNVGAIVGGVIGGCVALLLVALGVVYLVRPRSAARMQRPSVLTAGGLDSSGEEFGSKNPLRAVAPHRR